MTGRTIIEHLDWVITVDVRNTVVRDATVVIDGDRITALGPSRMIAELFKPSESGNQPAHWVAAAESGQLLWSAPSCGCDNGRGVAGDIYAGNPGAEVWSSAVSGLRSATNGSQVASRKPGSANFLIWWDADPVRELLDQTRIDKYQPSGDVRLLTGSGVAGGLARLASSPPRTDPRVRAGGRKMDARDEGDARPSPVPLTKQPEQGGLGPYGRWARGSVQRALGAWCSAPR